MRIAVYNKNEWDLTCLKRYLKKYLKNAEIHSFTDICKLKKEMNRHYKEYNMLLMGFSKEKEEEMGLVRQIHEEDFFFPVIVAGEECDCKYAFDVYAAGFIEKPFTAEHVLHGIYPLLLRMESGQERKKDSLFFSYGAKTYVIPFEKIAYISSNLHSVTFTLDKGETLQYRGKLSDFEEQLKESNIIRCHQSYFVNMEKIENMRSSVLKIGSTDIPVSKSRKEMVYDRYHKYLGNY